MATHAHYPSIWEAGEEGYEFEARLGYIVRSCFKTKTKILLPFFSLYNMWYAKSRLLTQPTQLFIYFSNSFMQPR
jgi:hypothetical protein